jgi:hypothetical protein
MSFRRFAYRIAGFAFDPWTGVPLAPQASVGGPLSVTTTERLQQDTALLVSHLELEICRAALLSVFASGMSPQDQTKVLN